MGDTLEVQRSNGITYPEWQPEFVAAITETDPVRMKDKIDAAEFAIFRRAQKLPARWSRGRTSGNEKCCFCASRITQKCAQVS